MTTTSYLLSAKAFVCVVQLVCEHLSVAGDGFVPAQSHRGRRVGHRLQVGSGARHLDWWKKMKRAQIKTPSNLFSYLEPSPLFFVTSGRQALHLAKSIDSCQKQILGYFKATIPRVSKSSDHRTAESLRRCGDQPVPSGLGCQPSDFLVIPMTNKLEVRLNKNILHSTNICL